MNTPTDALTEKSPYLLRLPHRIPVLIVALLGLVSTGSAWARPGYDSAVTNWCSSAGRVAPKAAKLTCDGCHALRPRVTPLFTTEPDPTTSSLLAIYCKASTSGGGGTANSAPVVTAISDKNATVGKKISFKVSAKDPDGDPITLSTDSQQLPAGASFNPATRTFSWIPAADQVTASSAPYTVTFIATDNQTPALTGSASVDIYVNAAGTKPPSTGTDATVRGIAVKAASWDRPTASLTVRGRILFTKGVRPTGLTVNIADDTGTTLGTANADTRGNWTYSDQNLGNSPCGIQVGIDTFTSQRKVAHSGCGVQSRDDDGDDSGDSSDHDGGHD